MVDRIDLMWPGLKKCPFCGSYDIATSTTRTRVRGTEYFTARITCRGCWSDVHGTDNWELRDAIAEAANRWNRRDGTDSGAEKCGKREERKN